MRPSVSEIRHDMYRKQGRLSTLRLYDGDTTYGKFRPREIGQLQAEEK